MPDIACHNFVVFAKTWFRVRFHLSVTAAEKKGNDGTIYLIKDCSSIVYSRVEKGL